MRPRFAVCVTRVVPSVCVGLFSRARGAVFCFIIFFVFGSSITSCRFFVRVCAFCGVFAGREQSVGDAHAG